MTQDKMNDMCEDIDFEKLVEIQEKINSMLAEIAKIKQTLKEVNSNE